MIFNNKITVIFTTLLFPIVHSSRAEVGGNGNSPEIFAYGGGDQALLSSPNEEEPITIVFRDGLDLICQARASGAIYWKWVVNGEETMGQYNIWNDNTDRGNQTTRIELPLSTNLEDKYTCVARNRLGVDRRSFTVVMTPLPSDGWLIGWAMEEMEWLAEVVFVAMPSLFQIPILFMALALMCIFWKVKLAYFKTNRMGADKSRMQLSKKLESEEEVGDKVEPQDDFLFTSSKFPLSEGLRMRAALTRASSFDGEIPGDLTPIRLLKLKKQDSNKLSEAKL